MSGERRLSDFCFRTPFAECAQAAELERRRTGALTIPVEDVRDRRAGMQADEQPVEEKHSGSGKGHKRKPAGDAKMREEASRALHEKSSEIANKLAKMAEDGDLKSLELLYKLSKKPDEQGSSRAGLAQKRSYAVRFATEPEWHEKSTEKAEQENEGGD